MQNPYNDKRDTLKDYVQKHPNNKMAWYLLGKDYIERGEVAKAKYCFIQAGEVYVAYEENPLPEILAAQQAQQAQQAQEREGGGRGAASGSAEPAKPSTLARVRRGVLRWAAILLLLLFLTGPASNAKENDQAEEAIAPPTEQVTLASGSIPSGNAPGSGATVPPQLAVFYATSGKGQPVPGKLAASEADRMLAPLIREAISGAPTTLLVEPGLLQTKWLDWQTKPKVLYSIEKATETSGAYKLSAFDKEICTCEPGDSSTANAQYAQWKASEEQRLILQSAVQQYKQQTGKLPESVETLAQAYPNNWIPGVSPEMKQLAPSVLAASSAQQPAQSASGNPPAQPPSEVNAPQAISSAHMLQEPLEIVVDKVTHRLAVVSGRIILRSYPVGLGGARTPEGEFAISEKVRNPNGRDNGDFGSRGMTLSDTNYAIHGTNQPTSIGADRSLGCIRMLKGDVEELFDMVPKGTKVTIGKNLLPPDIRRAEKPFQAPVQAQETNPGKLYKWLN